VRGRERERGREGERERGREGERERERESKIEENPSVNYLLMFIPTEKNINRFLLRMGQQGRKTIKTKFILKLRSIQCN